MSVCCKGLDALLGKRERVGTWDDLVGMHNEFVGFEPGKQYLTLHINNPQGLVAQQKGTGIAWATNLLVPEFIENTIYKTVSDELKTQFKAKGSDITVEITQTPPKGNKPTSDLKGGVFLGMLLVALGYGAVKLAGRAF